MVALLIPRLSTMFLVSGQLIGLIVPAGPLSGKGVSRLTPLPLPV
jgi:hypothetical protein